MRMEHGLESLFTPRRQFCALLVAALSLRSKRSAAGVIDLAGLGQAIDAAAGAFRKLENALVEAVSDGDHGFNVVVARRSRSRLVDIDARLQELAENQNTRVLGSLQSYINFFSKHRKDGNADIALSAAWHSFLQGLTDILTLTQQLLDDIQADRSDFVLQSTRTTLISALSAKIGILARLRQEGSYPLTKVEIEELAALSAKFDALRRQTVDATHAMSDYIRVNLR
jgi:hypothetical protein